MCFDNLSRLNLHLLCGNFELKLNDFCRNKSIEIEIFASTVVNFLNFKPLKNCNISELKCRERLDFSHLMIWKEIYRYFIVIFYIFVLKICF